MPLIEAQSVRMCQVKNKSVHFVSTTRRFIVSKTDVFETIAALNGLHLPAVLCAQQHATSSTQHNSTGSLPRDQQTPPPRPVPRDLGRRRRGGLAGHHLDPLDYRQQRARLHPHVRFHNPQRRPARGERLGALERRAPQLAGAGH
jgi:hypothetical protein